MRQLWMRWLPLLLPLLMLLSGLGMAPLFDVDEGAFSEATREMLDKGDYWSTWLNGNPRFDKPILIYWLQALSVSLFGAVEWAFRLPSALAAALWCTVISRFAREFIDEEAGWMAGLVALSCLGVQLIGRAATADALLNLFLALILTDLWRYLASGRMIAARRVFLWIGLGFLTKGPVAVLIPAATVFLWCLSSRQWAPLGRALRDLPGWALLLGVSLPWYGIAYAIHGDAFIQGFFIKHNVQRFSSTLEGHGGSLLYYLILLPLFLWPWLFWLGAALRSASGQWKQPLPRFLWLWCAFVVIFFSLSGTKLPHYVLYGCTPLFILLAAEYRSIEQPWAVLPALGLLCCYAALPFCLGNLPLEAGFYADQLSRLAAVRAERSLWPLGVTLLLALWTLIFWRPVLWRKVAALALLGNVLLSGWLAPLLGDVLQGPIKRAALVARAQGLPVVQWQTHWPSFSVYLAAETPLREPEVGELAVTRRDRAPNDAGWQWVYEEGGVVLLQKVARP